MDPDTTKAVPAVNRMVFEPDWLKDRLVHVATPDAFVCAVGVPPRLPVPVSFEAVTVTPETRLPLTSVTVTTGCGLSAAFMAAPPGCVFMVTVAAAPADSVMAPDVAVPARPVPVNVTVYVPTRPVMMRLENVAVPPLVVTCVVPLSTPLPLASDAVT